MLNFRVLSPVDNYVSVLFSTNNSKDNYILDCGNIGDLKKKESSNVKAIFITHTHIDHFQDFDKLLVSQLELNDTVTIVGPKDIHNNFFHKINSYTWENFTRTDINYKIVELLKNSINTYTYSFNENYLKLTSKAKSDTCYENNSFKVNYTILDHNTPSAAYKITEAPSFKIKSSNLKGGSWIKSLFEAYKNNTPLQEITIDNNSYKAEELFKYIEVTPGKSYGFIMDHALTENNFQKITTLFSGCDTVYIECFFLNSDIELAKKTFHSTAKASAEVLKRANVKEAFPIHYSSRYKETDILKKEFFDALNL